MDKNVSRAATECADKIMEWVKQGGIPRHTTSRSCGKRGSDWNETKRVKTARGQTLLGIGMQHLASCKDNCHGACQRILTMLGRNSSIDGKQKIHFTRIQDLFHHLGATANVCGCLLFTKEAVTSIMNIRIGKKVSKVR